MKYDWDDLRHFGVLAETLHLGEAAARLGTSQATVLRRVRNLETALGLTLFVRKRSGHQLTRDGRALIPMAREVEHVLRGLGGLSKHDRAAQGRVRIATTELGANWILLPRVISFQKHWPNITLDIDAAPAAVDLLEDAESIALRFHRPRAGDFVVKRLGALGFSLYAASSARTRRHIGWSGAFSDIALARWLRQVFGEQRPSLQLTTIQGHLDAARSGCGIAGLPDFIAAQFSELAPAGVPNDSVSIDAWIVIPGQIRTIPRIKTVVKFIESSFREVSRAAKGAKG